MPLIPVSRLLSAVGAVLLILCGALPAELAAQAPGRLMGRVLDAADSTPVVGALVSIPELNLQNHTNLDGRFVLVGIPLGRHTVQIERLGYMTHRVEDVLILAGQATELSIRLTPTALPLAGITVETARRRLIEAEIASTRETVLGTELRLLPIDAMDQAVQLTVGVTEGGHFRGGRAGQDVQVVDGLVVRNPLEASTQGSFLEFSPTSIEALEVTTGGFGAEYGGALSGVVSFATRRGSPDGWFREVTLRSDQASPSLLSAGHTQATFSLGGPLRFLGAGTTVFADVLAQGMVDADPRARGLTCLRPSDAMFENALLLDLLTGGSPEHAVRPDDEDFGLAVLQADSLARVIPGAAFRELLCATESHRIPHQRGDKLIGFARLDRPLGNGEAHLKVLRSRNQSELYTAPLLFNPSHQLGTREIGHLIVFGYERIRQDANRASRTVLRTAYTGSDRYLGTVDPWSFDSRSRVLAFGPRNIRFLGEDFVRSDVNAQLASGGSVPGHEQPSGYLGTPFGIAANGVFHTDGTPDIANWSRTHGGAVDLLYEHSSTDGHVARIGGSGRRYRIESYERTMAYSPASRLNYARFQPTTASAFGELRLLDDHLIHIDIGLRAEAFNAGLPYLEDRADIFGEKKWSAWQLSVMPRVGVAATWPGAEDRSMFRLNYSRVSQPPDFRFLLDTTIGDSLRTDIQRQGNPNLGFETGSTYEFSATQLLREGLAASLTVFHKNLRQLISGNLQFPGLAAGQFTTGDRGRVNGAELRLRGGWEQLQLRGGYALQKATGVGSTALDTGSVSIYEAVEYPLAFDRRHVFDMVAMAGAAAGGRQRWGVAATATLQSGLPLERRLASGDFLANTDTTRQAGSSSIVDVHTRLKPPYLPWNAIVNARASYELPWRPWCDRCGARIVLDGRNLLGRENIRALRPANAQISPDIAELVRRAHGEIGAIPASQLPLPIPRESPYYTSRADLDGDGSIGAWKLDENGDPYLDRSELIAARLAALIAAQDPSLFFGPRRVLQIGLEVRF